MMPCIEPSRGPTRGPRRSHLPDVAPGPGWRRSPSGFWLPPHPGEIVQASAYNITHLPRPQRLGGTAPFDPLSTAPRFFLRSAAGDVYQDSTGTPPGATPVSTVAQAVGAWRDVGSIGAHASQATTGRRPVVGQLAPFRATFNGSTTSLDIASTNITVATASTLCVKFRLANTTAAYRFVCRLVGATNAAGLYVASGGGGYTHVSARLGPGSSGTSVGFNWTLDTGWHVRMIANDGTSSTATTAYGMRFDGAGQTLSASGSMGASSGSIGAENVSTVLYNLFAGDLAFILYWDRLLTSPEITNVETWGATN